MVDSRLQRKLEQQTKRKLWFTVIGIILVLVVLVKYGIPLLINFSLFIAKVNNKPDVTQSSNNSPSFINAPQLDPLFNATNSAQITVTGSAASSEKIMLYVNGILSDEQDTKNDGSFKFTSVSLQTGNNTIKTKAKQDNSESDFSSEATVVYKNTPPQLSIDNPQDGNTFSKDDNHVNVTGKTDADAKVTVNDFWAINNSGTFSYDLHLQNGDNQIKVIATDAAGNKTEKDLKVTYNQ